MLTDVIQQPFAREIFEYLRQVAGLQIELLSDHVDIQVNVLIVVLDVLHHFGHQSANRFGLIVGSIGGYLHRGIFANFF
ncbi:hypothetical protein D3C85_1661670 [compost metagenome]